MQPKKDDVSFETTWMDLEDMMSSEISQSEKDKYDSTHMQNLKKTPNEQTKKCRIGPINIENRLMVARGKGGGESKMGEKEWQIQSSSHGMNKSEG